MNNTFDGKMPSPNDNDFFSKIDNKVILLIIFIVTAFFFSGVGAVSYWLLHDNQLVTEQSKEIVQLDSLQEKTIKEIFSSLDEETDYPLYYPTTEGIQAKNIDFTIDLENNINSISILLENASQQEIVINVANSGFGGKYNRTWSIDAQIGTAIIYDDRGLYAEINRDDYNGDYISSISFPSDYSDSEAETFLQELAPLK